MPLTVLDVDGFIRHAMFKYPPPDLTWHCRKSIFIEDTATKLGKILPLFRNKPSHEDDDIAEPDIILTWGGGIQSGSSPVPISLAGLWGDIHPGSAEDYLNKELPI
nr:hypothetical protein [uncultured Desulfobacter sp.]